jgi:hypothetical protein
VIVNCHVPTVANRISGHALSCDEPRIDGPGAFVSGTDHNNFPVLTLINEATQLAIYLTSELCDFPLKETVKIVSLGRYGCVGGVCIVTRMRMKSDRRPLRQIDQIKDRVRGYRQTKA